jgi:hypothetical protein
MAERLDDKVLEKYLDSKTSKRITMETIARLILAIIAFCCFMWFMDWWSSVSSYKFVTKKTCHYVIGKETGMFLGCKKYYLIDEQRKFHSVYIDEYHNANLNDIIYCVEQQHLEKVK